MPASLAQPGRATYAQRAGAIFGLGPILLSIFLPGNARAQDPGGDAVPLGLPPAAVILNSPIGGLPTTLGGAGGENDRRYQPAVPPPGGPGAPSLSIIPSIGVDEIFNSNIFESHSHQQSDFITAITPGIQIYDSTPRFNLGLQYAPSGLIYARHSDQDTIAQRGVLSGSAILIPDTLFVTANAFAAVVPESGGLGGFGITPFSNSSPIGGGVGDAPGALTAGKRNNSQELGAQITPYVEHRFGDVGTAKAGATLSEVYIKNGTELHPIPGTSIPGTEREQTGEATAQFLGGEDFGRVRYFALLDARRSTGTGVENGARSDLATNYLGFALTRMVTPFAELGYERIHFNTTNNFNVDDAVWQLGVVLTPNADSQISIGYGHRDGFDSPEIEGYYQLTPRTRATVRYTAGVSSDIGIIQSELGLTNFNALDNPVNYQTGAPLFLGNGLTGQQNGLFRNHDLVLSVSTQQDRNTIEASILRLSQTPVGSAAGSAPGIGETSTSFQADWIHLVSDVTSVGAGASYTRSQFGSTSAGNENFFGATVGISYRFTDTITAIARYSFFDRSSNFAGRSFTDNLVVVGVTKQFR